MKSPECGGPEGDRTLDLTDANRTLSQVGRLYASHSKVKKSIKLSIKIDYCGMMVYGLAQFSRCNGLKWSDNISTYYYSSILAMPTQWR